MSLSPISTATSLPSDSSPDGFLGGVVLVGFALSPTHVNRLWKRATFSYTINLPRCPFTTCTEVIPKSSPVLIKSSPLQKFIVASTFSASFCYVLTFCGSLRVHFLCVTPYRSHANVNISTIVMSRVCFVILGDPE